MKEIRTKLDIYVDYVPNANGTEEEAKEVVYSYIATILEKYKLNYQIYEQEIQEV